jgi:X-X-X-Leu-X-X-Gly heptad repeat protein
MAEEPDRLRQGIENTRTSLTRDVDMLADRTSPKRVAQRRWSAVKEKVMGSSGQVSDKASQLSDKASQLSDKASELGGKASELGDKAGGAVHDVAGSVRDAPRVVAAQTQGNPLAAGIIAFGAGLLAATLIPVTDAERRAGRQVKENTGELTDRVKDVAQDLRDDLSGSVQQAVGEVKDTASDAAQTTRDQARSSAQDATEQTRQAARNAS